MEQEINNMLKLSDVSVGPVSKFEGMLFRQIKMRNGSGIRLAAAQDNPYLMNEKTIDVSWLPFSSQKYKISPKISDYVLTEIPIVVANIPNRNLDAFPLKALTAWNDDVGRTAWQTFIGKPTHWNHDNRAPERAKGVIIDASLREDKKNKGLYRVYILAGWDRTKDAKLANNILDGKQTGFSMGCKVGYVMCSILNCGRTSPEGNVRCAHIEGGIGKGRIIRGQLTYEDCFDINFIECSGVEDPAQHDAHSVWAK